MKSIAEQIILGSMCGDGSISFKYKYPVYQEIHSIKQADYLIWKAGLLKDIRPKMYYSGSKSQQNKFYKTIGLYTPMSKELLKYHGLFYNGKNGEKHITSKILKMMKPLALAVWYMDDGSYNYSHSTVELTSCMNNFSVQKNIKRYFERCFGLKCYIHNVRGSLNLVRFTVESSDKFLRMIEKYIPVCMSYKLGHLRSDNDSKFDKIRSKARETALRWRKNNARLIDDYQKKFRLKNRERLNMWHRNHYKSNREKILARRREIKLQKNG